MINKINLVFSFGFQILSDRSRYVRPWSVRRSDCEWRAFHKMESVLGATRKEQGNKKYNLWDMPNVLILYEPNGNGLTKVLHLHKSRSSNLL